MAPRARRRVRITAFRTGLALAAAGSVALAVMFAGAAKSGAAGELGPSGSAEAAVWLGGPSLGYYTVHMPGFAGGTAFVQVYDPRGNVVREEAVRTRLAVGYFDFEESGTYALRVTNVSDGPAAVEAEIGGANSRELVPAGAVLIAGVAAMMASAYRRLAACPGP